jgi:hypothetical protein
MAATGGMHPRHDVYEAPSAIHVHVHLRLIVRRLI